MPELRTIYEGEDEVRELIDAARKVEGSRDTRPHAAGVVISRDPLVHHVPLQRAGGKSEGDVTTQFPWRSSKSSGCSRWTSLDCAR